MDYIKLTSSENLYTIEEANIPSVGTETDMSPQNGGFFWSSSDNNDALLKAIKQKEYSAANFMVRECVVKNFGKGDEKGKTALHILTEQLGNSNNQEIMQVIDNILNRCDKNVLNIKDSNGDTPLHIAARLQNDQLCNKFLEHGADPNIKNNNGQVVEYTQPDSVTITLTTLGWDDTQKQNTQNTVNEDEFNRAVNDLLNNKNSNNNNNANNSIYLSGRGLDDTSFSDDIDTAQLKQALELSMKNGSYPSMQGGANRTRKLRYYAQESGLGDEGDDDLERMINNQADEVHQRTVKKIMDLLKVDEETAKQYKNAIYRMVRDSNKDLTYLEKAYEMEKRATKETLNSIDIDKARDESQKLKEQRQKEKEERKKSAPKKKSSKKRKDSKKEKKEKKEDKPKKGKKEEKNMTESDSMEGDINLSSTSMDF